MNLDRRALLRWVPMLGLAFAGAAAAVPARATPIRVWKTRACGCCGGWVEHLRRNGFQPTVIEQDDLTPVIRRLGIPDALRSCHSAQVDGYFVEGHVPAADIRRLLAQRPAARGLAVPGMPAGSPGMEMGGRSQPYRTLLVDRTGGVRVFASH